MLSWRLGPRRIGSLYKCPKGCFKLLGPRPLGHNIVHSKKLAQFLFRFAHYRPHNYVNLMDLRIRFPVAQDLESALARKGKVKKNKVRRLLGSVRHILKKQHGRGNVIQRNHVLCAQLLYHHSGLPYIGRRVFNNQYSTHHIFLGPFFILRLQTI